jgi:hypothetical protein
MVIVSLIVPDMPKIFHDICQNRVIQDFNFFEQNITAKQRFCDQFSLFHFDDSKKTNLFYFAKKLKKA